MSVCVAWPQVYVGGPWQSGASNGHTLARLWLLVLIKITCTAQSKMHTIRSVMDQICQQTTVAKCVTKITLHWHVHDSKIEHRSYA